MSVRPGMSLQERITERRRILDQCRAAADQQAGRAHRSMRCYKLNEFGQSLNDERHSLCRGEEPGSGGCLCECHDPAPAEQVDTEGAK